MMMWALGLAAVQETRFDDAASHCAKAAQANPGFGYLYFFQAEALALAGRLEEAGPIARRGLELVPTYRISAFASTGVARSIADKLIEGARLLGLPE